MNREESEIRGNTKAKEDRIISINKYPSIETVPVGFMFPTSRPYCPQSNTGNTASGFGRPESGK